LGPGKIFLKLNRVKVPQPTPRVAQTHFY